MELPLSVHNSFNHRNDEYDMHISDKHTQHLPVYIYAWEI